MAYLRKVKTGWQINIYVGVDPKTGRPKRKTKVVRGTKKEAEKIMARMIIQHEKGTLIDPSTITLEAYILKWLKRKEISPTTYKSYKSIINNHIIPLLGKLKLKDIKPFHVQDYFDTKYELNLSGQSLRHQYNVLNNMFKKARKDRLIAYNPCEDIEPPKIDRTEVVPLNKQLVSELLMKLEDNWLFNVVYIALATGMRRSEIAGLKWSDVSNKEIHIQRSAVRAEGKGIIFKSPKTKSSIRNISIGEDTTLLLEGIKEKQEEISKYLGNYNKDDLVFPLENGTRLDPDIITKRWIKFKKDTKFNRFRFQDLRHTHSSLLLESGVNMKIIQERDGHSSIKTTIDIYSHLQPTTQKIAAKKIEEILKISGD